MAASLFGETFFVGQLVSVWHDMKLAQVGIILEITSARGRDVDGSQAFIVFTQGRLVRVLATVVKELQ